MRLAGPEPLEVGQAVTSLRGLFEDLAVHLPVKIVERFTSMGIVATLAIELVEMKLIDR
jgi:hypothetical protein